MNVFAALAVLAVLIVVHEAGHFLAATLQGIRVSGFSVGFGPALVKRQRRGVTYAIRALPLGGFVAFPDDDESSDVPSDDPDLLSNRPIPQRALVVAAGVLANLLLAWVVLLGQAAVVGLPAPPDPGVLVVAVQADGAAEQAGRVLAINNVGLAAGQNGVQGMVDQVKAAPGVPLTLLRERNQQRDTITLEPLNQKGQGRIGAQLQANLNGITRPARGPLELLSRTSAEFRQLLQQTVAGYGGLITNFKTTASQVSGPVKIVEMGAQLSEQGGSGLVLFMALISINLAVLNALPLPLLDGGQMVLLLIEALRGKPVPERLQLAVAQSGFVLILGLTLVLIIRDTSQLSVVQQLMDHR